MPFTRTSLEGMLYSADGDEHMTYCLSKYIIVPSGGPCDPLEYASTLKDGPHGPGTTMRSKGLGSIRPGDQPEPCAGSTRLRVGACPRQGTEGAFGSSFPAPFNVCMNEPCSLLSEAKDLLSRAIPRPMHRIKPAT